MEQEIILSGYCKAIDGSRTVLIEEGEPDCQYGCCPHETSCPIAKKIAEAGDQCVQCSNIVHRCVKTWYTVL